ncbi:hypothetical protein Q4E40_10285 [Pontibacter sp. BT731]|uniref:hypothetical protein n=1 Tax=Pontibacter coccineus TaxID=3063328 RepID=UPI0026E2C941|nr:hypothetical protein [Pontibacter sp. BT731]MDO6390513.1 hypothetical protein [Pontibacter sp. BT731]
MRGAISELALENICLSPAGIQAVVNARGTLTATIDKLQHFQPNIYRCRIKKLF